MRREFYYVYGGFFATVEGAIATLDSMKEATFADLWEDVQEAMGCLKAGGGLEKMHIAFYKDQDIGMDGVWDIWRLEGPTFVWHFRGAPHVHTYVNIASKLAAKS